MNKEITELKQQIQLLNQHNEVLHNCWNEANTRASKNQEKCINALRQLTLAKVTIEDLEAKNAELKAHLNPVELGVINNG